MRYDDPEKELCKDTCLLVWSSEEVKSSSWGYHLTSAKQAFAGNQSLLKNTVSIHAVFSLSLVTSGLSNVHRDFLPFSRCTS